MARIDYWDEFTGWQNIPPMEVPDSDDIPNADLKGRYVWVLLCECRADDENDEMDYSMEGVFISRRAALEYLRGESEGIGPELFDKLTWYQSPDNPGFIEAWDDEKWAGRGARYRLLKMEIES